MNNKTIARNSNIEILRCILMIVIVFYHLLVHGTNGTFEQFFDWQPLITTKLEAFFQIFSMFPVDCFMIISGYYGINLLKNGRIDLNKILKFYSPIFFYSVLFASIAFFSKRIGVKDYFYSFIPIINSNYWFASCYFIVLLLSPVLNYIFEQFKDKKLFILFFIGTGIINYLLTGSKFSQLIGISYNNLFIIIYCYFIGKFLNTYENKLKISTSICILIFFTSIIVEYTIGILSIKLVSKTIWVHLSLNSSPFTILQAGLIFCFFNNRKSFFNKICNLFGSASFAVYLIHENSIIRRPLYSIINGGKYKNTYFLIPYLIFAALIVFVVSEIIEIIRIYVFKLCRSFLKKNRNK